MNKYSQPLKLASLALAAIGYFVANELQRRETEEAVERVLAKREAEKRTPPQ